MLRSPAFRNGSLVALPAQAPAGAIKKVTHAPASTTQRYVLAWYWRISYWHLGHRLQLMDTYAPLQ